MLPYFVTIAIIITITQAEQAIQWRFSANLLQAGCLVIVIHYRNGNEIS